ncbi:MAG TPA: selenocysteine-specific translation elongation factor [Vicinamibacterales bacterium]|nr:selenocysteine-specific translation elongation factor [Vicinamibacterales bacterium]
MNRSIVIGTAGHIDHGKSALVRALTGTDPDRLKEEKERGITIDLGFAHTTIGGDEIAFVDVPGHERFVKNMLAGVGGIDAVLLVVAADESVMPQTREHFAICRLLGVAAGVIALTKTDLADPETIELSTSEVRDLVAGSRLSASPIVPVSARTGAGLDDLRRALASLSERLPDRRTTALPPRLPIDRVFSMRGFGTVATGTLTSGGLRVDDELVLLPSGRAVNIRGLQVHGAPRRDASAGQRVAVNLGGVDRAEVQRGDTLTAPGAFEVTRRFDARLELLPDAPPLKHSGRIRFHHGTTEVLGRVALGPDRYARLRLESPAVLTRGDQFVLRSYSPAVTIGGGVVLDPVPARAPVRTAAATARFAALDSTTHDAVAVFARERAASGITFDEVARRAGIDGAETETVVGELQSRGDICLVGDRVFQAGVVSALETRLLGIVSSHHAAQPLSEGIPRQEARERLFSHGAPDLFDYVVESLVRAKRLVARDSLSLPGAGVSLSAEEVRAQEALERTYRDAQLAPPDLAAAASTARIAPAVADRMAKLLVRQKTLVKIDALFFHADALARLRREIEAMKQTSAAPQVDVAAFKERFGLSRKFAIPLLEWLDRERVTRRVGDARVVL